MSDFGLRNLDDLMEQLVERVNSLESRVRDLEQQPTPKLAFRNYMYAEIGENSGDIAVWRRVLSMAATGGGFATSLLIHLLGGGYQSDRQFDMLIRIGNGGGLNAYIEWMAGNITYLANATIVAYSSGGIITVYLHKPESIGYFVGALMMASEYNGVQPMFYPGDPLLFVEPAGSLVFDSGTAEILLRQDAAGELYITGTLHEGV